MQVPADPRIAGLVDQLVADTVPGGRGIAAWLALLRAHATLVRQLAVDLVEQTGLTLGKSTGSVDGESPGWGPASQR